MNVSDIVKDAFKFPASNWKRYLILGLIVLASNILTIFNFYFKYSFYTLFMILPAYLFIFLHRGYSLRTVKNTINGNNELPAFNKWAKMLIDGLKVAIISILYFIIPGVILIIGIFLNFSFSGGKLLFSNFNTSSMVFLFIGILLFVLLMLFYEIGIANMAYKGKLEAALSFYEIKGIIMKIGWKKYLLLFMIILMVIAISTIVSYFLSAIGLMGILIFAFLISPYFTLIGPRIIGLIYKESI